MLRPSLLDLHVKLSPHVAPEYLLVFPTFAHVYIVVTTPVYGK